MASPSCWQRAFFRRLPRRHGRAFRRHFGTVEKVMGGLLVATGILFITGGTQSLSFWLLETFPGLQAIG